jgi:glycosyltransferase involved in cell wall biosynthesis
MVAREAMAYGRPVVVTQVGGLLDLSGPGVASVAARDVGALRAAVGALLTDRYGRLSAGYAAHERAAVEFGATAAAEALVRVYEAALR